MNREFLMLAETWNPDKHKIGGWYVSIKYDGQRCFWDGGVTRGRDKTTVPWANTAKDDRYTHPKAHICSGLWSRYGNIIHAPDWWLDNLPTGLCLDGELWLGRREFQSLRKIVSRIDSTREWERVSYVIFDSPSPLRIAQSGKINHPQFTKYINESDILRVFSSYSLTTAPFAETIDKLRDYPNLALQTPLPRLESKARERVIELLEEETAQGGEGLMLRNPSSYYVTKRSSSLLKVKPLERDQGRIVGWEPAKVGKLDGLMGALWVEWNGKTFKVSGFNEPERVLVEGPNGLYPAMFPTSQAINFKYVSLTDKGIPREARYDRVGNGNG